MEPWVVTLTAVASNGDITQLYPANATAGVDPASAVIGDQIRRPTEGMLQSVQLKTDGTNGGVIEIWDVSGHDGGINVSSAATLTDTQVSALISAGKARILASQNFAGDASTPAINIGPRQFIHGLAARFSNSGPTGTLTLNLAVRGGYCKTTWR